MLFFNLPHLLRLGGLLDSGCPGLLFDWVRLWLGAQEEFIQPFGLLDHQLAARLSEPEIPKSRFECLLKLGRGLWGVVVVVEVIVDGSKEMGKARAGG